VVGGWVGIVGGTADDVVYSAITHSHTLTDKAGPKCIPCLLYCILLFPLSPWAHCKKYLILKQYYQYDWNFKNHHNDNNLKRFK